MENYQAPSHVLKYYPKAIRSECFLKAFLQFARESRGIPQCRIASMLSICSDDLNIDSLPEENLIGPFFLGGLDGYPFVGKTGIGAFSHHIPKDGLALIFFGPHLGITNRGRVGKVVRQGQSEPSDCCGAAHKALQALEEETIQHKKIDEYDLDDYQQETLQQIALRHQREIFAAGPRRSSRRFLKLTEVFYRATHDQMQKLLPQIEFKEPALAFGGILINEDGGTKSDIEFRHAYYVDEGRFENITSQFNKSAKARYRAL